MKGETMKAKCDAIAVAIFLAMIAIATSLFGQVTVPDSVRQSCRGMCEIYSGNAGGTGCVVLLSAEHKHIHVLTAKHVIDNGGPYSVSFQHSDKKFPAILRATHPQADTAFLQVQRTAETDRLAYGVPVRRTPIQPGEMLFYGGYSFRGPLLYCGRVGRTSGHDTFVDGTSVSGCSGGPCFDNRGLLVSNLWGYIGNNEQMGMANPTMMLTALANRYGMDSLNVAESAMPVTFPKTMPYAQETRPANPNTLPPVQPVKYQQPQQRQPGVIVGVQGQPIQLIEYGDKCQPQVQPQLVAPQVVQQPQMVPENPTPGEAYLIGNGVASVPYDVYVKFRPAEVQIQKMVPIQPQPVIQSQPQVLVQPQPQPRVLIQQQPQPQIIQMPQKPLGTFRGG